MLLWLVFVITSGCSGSKPVVGFSLLVSTCSAECDWVVDDSSSMFTFSIDTDCTHTWGFVPDLVSTHYSGELVLLSPDGV